MKHGSGDSAPPCESCEFMTLCASKKLACRQFVGWFNAEGRYSDQERKPNRLDFHRVNDDRINIHQLRDRVGEIRRVAKSQGRDPTYSEISAAIGLDVDAVAELVVRYARKQGMRVSSVAVDDRRSRSVAAAEDSPVNA